MSDQGRLTIVRYLLGIGASAGGNDLEALLPELARRIAISGLSFSSTGALTFSSGVVGFADGLVSAPSISFSADPTTGLYRSGSGLLSMASSGLTQFLVGNAVFRLRNTQTMEWSSGSPDAANADLRTRRSAAGIFCIDAGVVASAGAVVGGTTLSLGVNGQSGGTGTWTLNTDGSLEAASLTYALQWAAGTKIKAPSDGVVTLLNNAATAFNRLQFGGTTASFPSLKRNGTSIEFRLADDSGDCGIITNGVTDGSFVNTAGSFNAATATAITAGGSAGVGFKFSSTANFGIFFGSGAPTISAAKGSLYLRSDAASNVTRAYINTDGGTTWTAINTVA